LYGNWNTNKLTPLCVVNHNYAAQTRGAHTVMSWDGNKPGRAPRRQYVCFVSTNLALISDRREQFNRMLDVLDGRAPRLADAALLARLSQPAGRPFFWLSAVDVNQLVANNQQAGVLQQMRSLTIRAFTNAQGVEIRAEAPVAAPQAAQQLQQVLVGFQSLALLQAGKNPDLADVAQNATISADATTVKVKLTLPQDLVRRLIARKAAATPPPAPEAAF
jgi:hypothetical protein